MKRIKWIVMLVGLATTVSAQQSIEGILQGIEQNNTVLSVLREQSSAEKVGNKTGIYLANPEVEFHYLWGNSDVIGNRTDVSATQDFDFPTAYHYKRKVSDRKNEQVDLKYQIERNKILLEAKEICIQLIYRNLYSAELEKRMLHARQIADAYQTRYTKGQVNILDLNKAKFNLLNAEKELSLSQTEKDRLLSELVRLNGGNSIQFAISGYSPVDLFPNFEEWYASLKERNLFLQYLQKETFLSKESEKLQRSMNLPKFSAGYMSEKVMNEHFQGVTVGISVPLWENKNTVKKIKTQIQANMTAETDAELRFYNETKALYDKALKLRKITSDYSTSMAAINSSDLLKKALDVGEISLIEYMLELGIYYEAVNNLLETERDYQLIVMELKKWE